jgi:hypothetical protein
MNSVAANSVVFSDYCLTASPPISPGINPASNPFADFNPTDQAQG